MPPTPQPACYCDGRYDGREHQGRCTEPSGSPRSGYFCPGCDDRRCKHILRNLADIAEEFTPQVTP